MKAADKLVFKIPVVIEKDTIGYHAFCPIFKGIHVDGDTEDMAFENAREAIDVYLMSLIKHNEPIPLCAFDMKSKKEMRKIYRIFNPPEPTHLKHVYAAI